MLDNITLNLLITKYGSSTAIPYRELLLTEEWLAKRKAILDINNRQCSICGLYPESQIRNGGEYFFQYDKTEVVPVKGELSSLMGLSFWKSSEKNHLEVHHKYYVLSSNFQWRLPWNYKDEALQSVCSWCHDKHHRNSLEHVVLIQTTSGELKHIDGLTPCSRCDGYGWISEFSYNWSGVCFFCNGDKFLELKKPLR